MIQLTDEEITAAYYNAWNQEYEFQYEKKDEDKCHALGRNAIAKAQLKKVVEWGDEDCPHLIGEDLGGEKICWQSKKECPECRQALLEEVK